MKKFKFGDKEIESNYPNNVLPVVIGKDYEEEAADFKKLSERFKEHKIFEYSTHTINEKTGEMKPITYYYIGAECIEAKKYKLISEYDYEIPPKNMLIEINLQVGTFKRKFYNNIKNINCSMIDLLETATEKIKEKLFANKENEYINLFLYDDGGWNIDVEITEDEVENFITSVRLVEEV